MLLYPHVYSLYAQRYIYTLSVLLKLPEMGVIPWTQSHKMESTHWSVKLAVAPSSQ